MIWLAAFGGAGPISSTGKSISTVTIGSNAFNLYKGPNVSTKVFSIVATQTLVHFSADLKDFLSYLVKNHGLPLTQCLTDVQAGTEPFVGTNAEMTVQNYSDEAVIYVRGQPFTARRSARLNENDLVPGITGHKVQILESSLKKSLPPQSLSAADHRFEYWNEVAPGENELVVEQAAPHDVVTLTALYETLNVGHSETRIEPLVYRRLHIERENDPEQKHVDMPMNLIDGIRGDETTDIKSTVKWDREFL
ncbi:hypothetical protein PsorP6_001819 [Peronosclerospora sorghi]|uniref:Uncharacterized protein n=1 Tax=Peronosclerospora sorghi TaxID=230839 RepID=A0ACC0WVJ3_9STRA|nr:hypothetical protein PsorP6_001819 [Peronosclerospora sorghi]